ncbi:hypothetical protein Tco_0925087 [Tanacetum coccineum]|uniref:Uncharacterized protein n=1 Tax=Tanacetum coccineum TaxID=301880 RepID=A0ABQ5D7V1_9ASTR
MAYSSSSLPEFKHSSSLDSFLAFKARDFLSTFDLTIGIFLDDHLMDFEASHAEKGSYIPWASRFRRYLNRKRDNRKWLLKALDEGPYEFKIFTPEGSPIPRLQTAEDHKRMLALRPQGYVKELNFDDGNIKYKTKLTRNPNTGSSSRQTSSYYVTHHTSVVDYDDEYQQDDVHNNFEDLYPLQMLLHANYYSKFLPSDNNHLRCFTNTENNQSFKAHRVTIQTVRTHLVIPEINKRRAYFKRKLLRGNECSEETWKYQRLFALRLRQYFNIQFYNNYIGKRTLSKEMAKAKLFVTRRHCEKDTHVPDLCAVEKLARNAYQEAKKQRIFAQQVQTQNTHLTSQLEMYKERVRILENINKDNNYLNEFLEADERAKRYNKQAQSQLVRDRE